MLDAYVKILATAKSKSAENKKFLDKIKKSKPGGIDNIVNDLHEKAFRHINCLECANCCNTTGPLLLDRDISRLAKHFNIKPSEFSDIHLRIDEDGDYIFQSMPCPFLGADKYCSVYDQKPKACAEFPHTQQRNFLHKIRITYNNTLICPAVAEIVEGLKKLYPKI